MIAVTDAFMAGVKPVGLQRGRGGFLRSADDSPYVSDPTGDVVKSGKRRGEVKRIKYGSPSNAGRLVENDVGLVKHRQRLSLAGIGMDPSLAERCRELAELPVGSPEFNTMADGIVVAADKLTRSELAADRGTHGHLILELFDRKAFLSPEIIATGEALGLSAETQADVIHAWRNLLRDNGLEVLAIEASCVDDIWRLAGTLDRIVRTTRPLTFVKKSGELVVIPENTRLIGDVKFGKLRPAHPIQCASYDQSVPYDTVTEARGEWGFELSHEHALIFHGSFDPPSIELVWVDLVAGREHGGQCVVDAKAWAARDDVFSVAQIAGEVEAASACGVPPSPAPPQRVIKMAGVFDCSPQLADELEAHTQAENKLLEVAATFLTPDPARLALVDARAALCPSPDEGADWSSDEYAPLWDELRGLFDRLEDGRWWRSKLVTDAQRRCVNFAVQRTKTERRYWINKAVICLALAGERDDILRELLSHIIGDVALMLGVEPGHALGSLDHMEAKRFADHVDAYLSPLHVA